MSVNSNNQPKSLGVGSSSPFGNAGMVAPSMGGNPTFSQSQAHIAAGFQNQFQLSQAQAIAQAQSKAQAQVQAAHAQFQAQLQAQGLTLNQNQGIANLGSSSPSLSTPGNSGLKRFPQKPPMRPPGISPTNMLSSLRTMELTPAARRKKQKLPEKQLQDKVSAILPESALYTQLLEFEARVDTALSRKKVDIQEALKSPPCIQKTLRIYVFNTFANQIRTIPKKPNAEPPTWTLKIVGRILEDGIDPDQPGVVQKTNPLYPKFSSFFKRVTISLDQRLYPDNHIIMWENARSPAPHEGFEVKRKGDKEFTVNIRLEMNYMPEKFKLSQPLMEVLGIEVDTRPRIIAAIWQYVKARKLQNPNDPSFFYCDPPLQKVFGEDRMKFTMVSQKISQHLVLVQIVLSSGVFYIFLFWFLLKYRRRAMAVLHNKFISLHLLFLISIGYGGVFISAELQRFQHPAKDDGSLSFLVLGDWGRRGAFNQSQVAFQMGKIGEKLDIDFVVSTGDNFYDNGLTSEHDTAFEESFTKIYTAKSLQKQWYSVLGNHDYRGDAEAQLSPLLRKIDSRWLCLRSFVVNAELAEIFFVDTTPFVGMYFSETEDHTYDWRGINSQKAYVSNLLKEVELAVRESSAKWKIVVGHHAIRSVGHHGDTQELIDQLLPILQANNVDFYMNGHDHCLEHIGDSNSPIQFLTSGAGSKAWRGDIKGLNKKGLNFFYDGQGFMSVNLTPTDAEIAFYDVFGNVLHRLNTSKQLHSFI